MGAALDRLASLRLALLGAAAATFQTLFARQFLSAFTGNEAVLAALLGPWLIWTAIGAHLGRRSSARAATAGLLTLAGSCALSLTAARVLPRAFDAGAAPGATSALGWAFLLLGVPCLAAGFSFSRLAASAGRAYFAESAGSAVAGAALSLVFLGRVGDFALAGGLVVAAGIAAALELHGTRRWLALLAAGALGVALGPLGGWALEAQGPQMAGAVERDSPSASLVTVTGEGQQTLFADRIPLLSGRDLAAAEEAAHVPLALVAHPRAVAVLGVPPAGTLKELQRHGLETAELVLDDPSLLAAVRAIEPFPPQVQARVEDARRFLERNRGRYDAVLLFAPEPTSAQLNRLYTAEFFGAARSALAPGGLFALGLPGHAAYASAEKRRLHSSLARTLESVFTTLRVLPLSRTVYLASDATLPESVSCAGAISSALASRNITPVSLTAGLLEAQLAAPRIADAKRWASLPEDVNRDLRPTTYRIALERALAELGDLGTLPLAGLALILAVGALLVFRPRSRPVELAVLTSGAAGLAGQLVVMLAYQIAAGALYREIGLLLAGFMVGAALGAWADGRGLMPKTRGVLLADSLQVLVFLGLFLALPSFVGSGGAARPLAFAGSLAIGVLPGAQFAAAGRALGDSPATAGALYAADLFGAALAALLAFTTLVPLLGMRGALLALAGLKLASTGALLLPARKAIEPASASLAPAVPALLVATVAMAAADQTEGTFYALTFTRAFQLPVVLALLLGLVAAFEPKRLREWLVAAERRLGWIRERTRATAGRLTNFVLLLPVAAFPLGRCYFQVPYVFCHVCPRPCVFGVMRPYLVPAAVIANLWDRRFCEKLCPLGTAQSACDGMRRSRARRVTSLAVLRLVALALIAAGYFLAREGKGEGILGGGLYELMFRNAFTPSAGVLLVAAGLLLASLFVRRPFCEGLCPIGATAGLLAPLERRIAALLPTPPAQDDEPQKREQR